MAQAPEGNPVNPVTPLLLLSGVAIGAALTWAYFNGGREKLSALNGSKLDSSALLKNLTDILTTAREQVLSAVDATSEAFKS